MPTVSYKVALSCSKGPFSLCSNESSFPLFIVDKESVFASETAPDSSIYKYLETPKTSGMSTSAISNTTDVRITDIKFNDVFLFKKLFYKKPLDVYDPSSLVFYINDSIAYFEYVQSTETYIIYTNDVKCNVLVANSLSKTSNSFFAYSYDVFPPEYSSVYFAVKHFDNRHFTYQLRNGSSLLITANRPKTQFTIDAGPLFELKQISHYFAGIKPCIHKEYVPLSNKPSIIEYNYSTAQFKVIESTKEWVELSSSKSFFTKYGNVLFDSINLVSVNKNTGSQKQIEVSISNCSLEYGYIWLEHFEDDIKLYDFYISYKAIHNLYLYESIESAFYLKRCIIGSYVSPTNIIQDGKAVGISLDPKLNTFIIDKTSHSSTSTSSIFSDPYYLSHYAFADKGKGYLNQETNNLLFELNEITPLKVIEYGNVSAWIFCGQLDFNANSVNKNLVFNSKLANQTKSLMPFKTLNRHPASIIHFSADGNYSNAVFSAGITAVKHQARVLFDETMEALFVDDPYVPIQASFDAAFLKNAESCVLSNLEPWLKHQFKSITPFDFGSKESIYLYALYNYIPSNELLKYQFEVSFVDNYGKSTSFHTYRIGDLSILKFTFAFLSASPLNESMAKCRYSEVIK